MNNRSKFKGQRSAMAEAPDLVAARDKVKELTAAVKDLTLEAQRLQTNLNRLHGFQASLLVISQHWMQWMERSKQLQGQGGGAGSSTSSS